MEELKTLYYKVPALARWLHTFPHYNLEFVETDSTFDPIAQSYQESLLVAGAVFGVWLGLWLVIFLIYFLCACFRKRRGTLEKPVGGFRPVRWSTVIFVLLVLTSIIVAFYGNEKTHIGVEKAAQSLSEFSDDTENVYVQAYRLRSHVQDDSNYTRALKVLTSQVSGQDVKKLDTYRHTFYHVVNQVIPRMVRYIELSPLMKETKEYEQYRWMTTLGVCLWQVICCLILWCSIGMKSRCMLLMCVGLFIFNMVLAYGGAMAYTALSVAGGDFCVYPNSAVRDELNRISGNVSLSTDQLDVIDYYLKCAANDKSVYFAALSELQNALISSNNTLLKIRDQTAPPDAVSKAINDAQQGLNEAFTAFLKLTALADCTAAHKSYVEAISNVCHNSLTGLVYLAFAFIAAGIFMTVAVFLIHISSKSPAARRSYYDVDSQEPFIQRVEQQPRSENPLYYSSPSVHRFSQISTNDEDHRSAPAANQRSTAAQPGQRSSPPPAYNTGEFYSTYGNSETLDSRPGHESEPLSTAESSFRN